MEIPIKYITVLLTTGTDRVRIHTSLPSPFPIYTDPLVIDFDTVHGGAVAYLAEHFPGIPVAVVDCRPK